MKKVFVCGDFNILHPGHLRLLKFAKESGDYLIVGVNSDNIANNKGVKEDIRLESIKATSYVDEAFLINESSLNWIKKYKPNVVVKGQEHKTKFNPELSIIKEYGGNLLFSSGEIGFSSLDILKKEFEKMNHYIDHHNDFLERHNINFINLQNIINKFKNLKILVLGDTIVDEYVTCEPLGMSQEDPTIVVKPLNSKKFVGGAAIVASHAKSFGAKVSFLSVTGEDENKNYIKQKLTDSGIEVKLFEDYTRPTTLKQRFRANSKTLLRVNHLKQHSINEDIENEVLKYIKKNIKNIDLIVFSDFSYGFLTKKIIKKVLQLAEKYNIFTVADSQSSSQVGDISKFKNTMLVTPTEREIRLALSDFESGLVILSEKLVKKSKNKYIVTTLGPEGLMIYNTNNKELLTDNINALSNIVKDVSGAGDSLMITSAMAMTIGANIWESSYLGSLASAIQVSRVGNTPIKKDELLMELKK